LRAVHTFIFVQLIEFQLKLFDLPRQLPGGLSELQSLQFRDMGFQLRDLQAFAS
jgi:hypothetical protein